MSIWAAASGILKLTPLPLAAVAVCSGVLVFGPEPFLDRLSVKAFAAEYGKFLGPIFLLSISLLGFYCLVNLAGILKPTRKVSKSRVPVKPRIMRESPIPRDSNVKARFYDDAVAPPAKQVGAFGEDVVKAIRWWFTRRFRRAAARRDLYQHCLYQARSRVPENRRKEVPPEIDRRVPMNLQSINDDNILQKFYVNYLTSAIDVDVRGKALPEFVNTIERLSPDEAVILFEIQNDFYFATTAPGTAHPDPYIGCAANGYPLDKLEYPKEWDMYCDHLESLNLVKVVKEGDKNHTTIDGVGVTAFGRGFIEVCVPETEELDSHRKTP